MEDAPSAPPRGSLGHARRWLVPIACALIAYVLCVAPRLRPQSTDTSPGMLGAIVLACHGDQNLGRIPWLDTEARRGALPYWAAISADGRELVSTFGPTPSVLGRIAFLSLEPRQHVDDFDMRLRARRGSAVAIALATALIAIALLAWTPPLVAGAGALVAATSFAGAATMGQGLWQQTAALPFVAGAIAALAWSARENGSRAAVILLPALAVAAALIRPADAFLSIAFLACWALVAKRRGSLAEIGAALGVAAIAAGPFLVWNLVHLGTVLPNGQWVRNLPITADGKVFSLAPSRLGLGTLGLLFSPARSWILFAPIAIVGLVLAIRRHEGAPDPRVGRVLVAGVVAELLLSASFFRWWGGYSFGPRLLTAATWIAIPLAFARLPALGRRGRALVAATALSTSALGVAGLFGFEILQWETPHDPDKHPEVLWQVSDSPIRALFSPPIEKRRVPPGPPPLFCPEGPTGRWAVAAE